MKKINLFILLVALVVTSCNNKPIIEEEGFDYGAVKNNRYTNRFFDIQIAIPQNWVVQTQEQSKELMKEGAEFVAGDNEKMKAAIKASEVNSASLLTVFQYKEGIAEIFNPSFMLVAESLKRAPGVRSGEDYLSQSRKLLLSGQVQYKHIDENFKKVRVNGWEFYAMNLAIEMEGVSIYQTYMATVKDGFALCFIYSYNDEEQKAQLEKVVQSIDYYKKK
ncbi:hypothetical protein [Flavobacterium subsaxonicum]|uniref:PsbP C-terminal domain-containing protein n=1 Tax=Flavobacterium subsaxonicum WB 4.1-42 = DSM 21790 TaxID=1121898 RepID=A0A0A2MP89_9FLAO|nr:hypothetical protein [Flavobacterium subsaxonicum]KGO93401.1 hypothetical protein Q766_08880 [Flavobacterium subsaxonicum WB 4.1-42 = DSM 21790]